MELHNAITTGNRAKFVRLLNDGNTDLNVRYYNGDTPLLLSLKQRSNNYRMAMDLIKAGCDITISDNANHTALHKAVVRHESFEVALELAKRGIDVNAQDVYGHTPLHEAIRNAGLQFYRNNLENVCMLLYYGADVNIACRSNRTPLMVAFYQNETVLCELLINFYHNFSLQDCEGNSTLHYAVLSKHYLALDIVRAGANVNCISNSGIYVPLQSLAYEDAELFKLTWKKTDYDKVLTCTTPFLYVYISRCNFNDKDWLECLYILLTSIIAEDLVAHCTMFTELKNKKYSFLKKLIRMFKLKQIKAVDRIAVLNLCLSLGAEALVRDIIEAKRIFGFNEEFQALLHVSKHNYSSAVSPSYFSYYLGLDDDFSLRRILYFMKNLCQHKNIGLPPYQEELEFILKRFSVPNYYRRDFENVISQIGDESLRRTVLIQLNEVPSFPSLLELSRNAVHAFVKENFLITKLYHFQDTVKKFKLPQTITDLVLFKEPLH